MRHSDEYKLNQHYAPTYENFSKMIPLCMEHTLLTLSCVTKQDGEHALVLSEAGDLALSPDETLDWVWDTEWPTDGEQFNTSIRGLALSLPHIQNIPQDDLLVSLAERYHKKTWVAFCWKPEDTDAYIVTSSIDIGDHFRNPCTFEVFHGMLARYEHEYSHIWVGHPWSAHRILYDDNIHAEHDVMSLFRGVPDVLGIIRLKAHEYGLVRLPNGEIWACSTGMNGYTRKRYCDLLAPISPSVDPEQIEKQFKKIVHQIYGPSWLQMRRVRNEITALCEKVATIFERDKACSSSV